jgi:hypothetical protein
MDWIKKNPHLFSLALLATVLLAAGGLVINNALHFPENFAALQENIPPGTKLAALDLTPIEEGLQNFQKPAIWVGQRGEGNQELSLFVPEKYIIDAQTNMPKQVGGEGVAFYKDSLTKAWIPNKWFLDNKLPLSNSKVQFEDPDRDGFLNEDEWRGEQLPPGSKPTDPNNKDSHPSYPSKLFLKQYIRVPFHLKFQAYDGDQKKPEAMEFQINATDRRRSEFLKLGDKFPSTSYELKKFEYKTQINPKTNEEEDVSELTVFNTETEDSVVLPMNKLIDSPDSYALFIYEWPNPPQQIKVKKAGPFALPPETSKIYKLLDIQQNKAVIQTPAPDSQKITISPDPRLQ